MDECVYECVLDRTELNCAVQRKYSLIPINRGQSHNVCSQSCDRK